MTNESSDDSTHREPAISPRHAASAAREKAASERLAQQTEATAGPAPSQEGTAASGSDEAGDPRDHVEPRGERSGAVRAALQAGTKGARRARAKTVEAQRAAAERTRQTQRPSSASLREKSEHLLSSTGRSATLLAERPDATQDQAIAEPANVLARSRDEHEGDRTPTQPIGASMLPGNNNHDSDPDPGATDAVPPAEAAGPNDGIHGAQQASFGDGAVPVTSEPAAPEGGFPPHESLPPVGPGSNGGEPEPDAFFDSAEAEEPENLFLGTPVIDPEVRKARHRRRNWVITVVLLGFCAVIFGVVVFVQGLFDRFSPEDYPAPGGEAVLFEVESGWGKKKIGRELVNRDIVASNKLFSEAVQLVETENREIHPGTYDLRRQMPALDAASILIGEDAAKVSYVAIKDNTRISKVLQEISKSTGLPLKDLKALADDPAALGVTSNAPNLEGYLHPGQYRFPLDVDAKTVLGTMVEATTKTLNDAGITDPAEQYHVLKVASILQAEARKDDYGIVAGALENRLRPGNKETKGLLQVDSTVIYGLDRYSLQFSAEEKKDAGNKFNTYLFKGLPPTPIGSPGDSAIQAAANPTPNDYYYWVTVNINTGETKFAKTYAEHRVNQDEFRDWCAANKGVCK